jgi:hypothetical protein
MAGWFNKKRQPEEMPWQEDEMYGLEVETEEVEAVGGWDTQCAWCLQEQGIDPGSGSHGICDYHSAQVYQAYRASRRR